MSVSTIPEILERRLPWRMGSPEQIRTAVAVSPRETWLVRPGFGQPRPSRYQREMDNYALLVSLDGLL